MPVWLKSEQESRTTHHTGEVRALNVFMHNSHQTDLTDWRYVVICSPKSQIMTLSTGAADRFVAFVSRVKHRGGGSKRQKLQN